MADIIPPGDAALVLENLDVAYRVHGKYRQVLRGLNLTIRKGEAYGLVGESGCGKSTAALAAIRYLPRNGRITKGRILVDGRDLMALSQPELRQLRTSSIAMVYQDPGRALNPSLRIERQMTEVFEATGKTKPEARELAEQMLRKVRIAAPERVLRAYPHQLSGGMQQRVVIAMALSNNPTLLILDEPTTGLDATVEAEVLDLIQALRAEFSTSILLISHSLAVVSKMCDRVSVLYAGGLMEDGPSREIFETPRHPYTVGLLRCLPRYGQRKDQGRLDTIPGFLPPAGAQLAGCIFADRCGLVEDRCHTVTPPLHDLGGARHSACHRFAVADTLPRVVPEEPPPRPRAVPAPVLQVQNLSKTFKDGDRHFRAVGDVSFALHHGETLGLVGESGSGKTTIARMLLGLIRPDPESRIELNGKPLPGLATERTAGHAKALQIIFQNPDSALNRAHTVRSLIGRSLTKLAGVVGAEREKRVRELAHTVRLPERHLSVKPRQLSGGQKQRVAIARAFAGEPDLVICDEPTSALDVSVQAAILNQLGDLQSDRGVSYIFISHDLNVVRYLSDRIAVLYMGTLLEVGPAEQIFAGPQHPYTEALLSASPSLGAEEKPRVKLEGEMPSMLNPPAGCIFESRCPRRLGEICRTEPPPMRDAEPGHGIRCHIPADELRRLQGTAGEAMQAAGE
jgi:peptide/nickel transport system ATP-binding protein